MKGLYLGRVGSLRLRAVIVTRQQARRIKGGRKSQHRYPRRRKALEVGSLIPVTYYRPNEGLGFDRDGLPKNEAVRACRVRVHSCRPGRVGDATEHDAQAEGYRSLDELRADWPDADALVWIVTFEIEPEEPRRYLSRSVVAGRVGGYVDDPARGLPNEPEAVDEETQRRLSREARERDWRRELDRRRERREMDFEDQVEALAAEARARHIDVRDELRAIRRWRDPVVCAKQLAAMRAKIERETVSV